MTRKIFIFNPETDYALSLGRAIYNPPAAIVKLARSLRLTPVKIASPGDIIMVDDDFDPANYPDKSLVVLLEERGVKAVSLSQAAALISVDNTNDWNIIPWGWNHSLRHKLLVAGFPSSLLKSETEIDALRLLSHRRTVIPFQKQLRHSLPHMAVPEAHELTSVDEAISFLKTHENVFFKAPWSSSGRGVVRAAVSLLDNGVSERKLREWLCGFIRRQGSVMGEKALDKTADCATEWYVADGRVVFLGLSLFAATNDGKYIRNQPLSQREIDQTLSSLSPFWDDRIINAQREALEAIILPHYTGPVGIDMLITPDGQINPCIEINLRLTMGMISLGTSLP